MIVRVTPGTPHPSGLQTRPVIWAFSAPGTAAAAAAQAPAANTIVANTTLRRLRFMMSSF
jgi:hypothetical protein